MAALRNETPASSRTLRLTKFSELIDLHIEDMSAVGKPPHSSIADNLASHKGLPARQMIRDAGAHLLFLPPHSPDLNPIEMVLAKLKTLFRKTDERSIEASWRRAGTLRDTFTKDACQNDLRLAGYASI